MPQNCIVVDCCPKIFYGEDIGGLAVLLSRSSRKKTNWQIKLWQVGHTLPNPSKFSPVKVWCYTSSYMVAI